MLRAAQASGKPVVTVYFSGVLLIRLSLKASRTGKKSLLLLIASKEEPAPQAVVEKPATTERPARNEDRRNVRQQSRNHIGSDAA